MGSQQTKEQGTRIISQTHARESKNVPHNEMVDAPPPQRKIVIYGAHKVGKTTLFESFCEKEGDDKNPGFIEFFFKKSKEDVALIFLDTTEKEGVEVAGGSIVNVTIKGAHAVILMFDVTKKSTWLECQKYWNQVKEICSDGKWVDRTLPVIFLANKIDLLYASEFRLEELKEIEEIVARIPNSMYFEVSANDSESVMSTLEKVLNKVEDLVQKKLHDVEPEDDVKSKEETGTKQGVESEIPSWGFGSSLISRDDSKSEGCTRRKTSQEEENMDGGIIRK